MHTIVRYYIRSSIFFLVCGLVLGFYFLLDTYWFHAGYPSLWVTAHVHVVLIGFVMMMIFGVAQWMFPRPPKEETRYSPVRALVIFYLLFFATALRFLLEISSRWLALKFVDLGIVVAGAGQILALILFFWNMWTRIRPMGSEIREQAGERF